MHKLPDNMFYWGTQIVYATVCPAFFFLFILVYEPLHLKEFLDMGRGIYAMNLAILTSIVFVTVSGLRVAFHFLRKSPNLTWALYVTWCMGEVLTASIFVSLYVYLMLQHSMPYFSVLLHSIGNCYLILTIPYVVLTLAFDVGAHKNSIRELLSKGSAAEDAGLVRFHDIYHTLKLIIAQNAILYVESDENYVNIVYTEAGKTRRYTLRATMRSLEESMDKHGLVRCHRSYYVNPAHVSVLGKEGGQLIARLDVEGLPGIPVSKGNYDNLAKLL